VGTVDATISNFLTTALSQASPAFKQLYVSISRGLHTMTMMMNHTFKTDGYLCMLAGVVHQGGGIQWKLSNWKFARGHNHVD